MGFTTLWEYPISVAKRQLGLFRPTNSSWKIRYQRKGVSVFFCGQWAAQKESAPAFSHGHVLRRSTDGGGGKALPTESGYHGNVI